VIGQAIAHTSHDFVHGLLLVGALLALYFLASAITACIWSLLQRADDGMGERRRLSEPVDYAAEIRVPDLSRRGPDPKARA
jgi:hypothetical protein